MKKAIIVLLSMSLAISSCASKTQQGTGTAKKHKVAVGVIGDEPENSNALNGLSTELTKAIVKSGKYTAVNRSEDILKQLGKEHKYQNSGAVDDEQIKQLGKQFAVQYLCIVRSTRMMDGYMLEARIVDVETAAIADGMMGSEPSRLASMNELMRVAEELTHQLLGTLSNSRSAPHKKIAPLAPIAPSSVSGVLTDERDSKKYRTVKIGKQTWMAENLNYAVEGSKCYGEGGEVIIDWYLDEDHNRINITKTLSATEIQANCTKYGRLYDWATAKNVCPSGWHLPSKSEYEALDRAVGGEDGAGKKLKATNGWNKDGNGTDAHGFSALPGGGGSDGSFSFIGLDGKWWSASEKNSDYAYIWRMFYGYEDTQLPEYYKSSLNSVRCVQD
jgi:uncharacterized protein (TIGR02145 family)